MRPGMPARGHHRAFRARIAPLRAAATPSRVGDGRTAGGTVASNRRQYFQATDDALADRFSGRQDDAHQPRSHLSGPVRPRPRSAAPRTDGLLANRAGGAGAEGAPEILTGRLGRDVENFASLPMGKTLWKNRRQSWVSHRIGGTRPPRPAGCAGVRV